MRGSSEIEESHTMSVTSRRAVALGWRKRRGGWRGKIQEHCSNFEGMPSWFLAETNSQILLANTRICWFFSPRVCHILRFDTFGWSLKCNLRSSSATSKSWKPFSSTCTSETKQPAREWMIDNEQSLELQPFAWWYHIYMLCYVYRYTLSYYI